MLYKVVALLTLPVLIVQGKRARKTAIKLPEPEGERKGTSTHKHGQALSLLIIGDSSAAGVGVANQKDALLGQLVGHLETHFDVMWQLVGETGAKTQDIVAMLRLSDINTPVDVVVTSLGVNDVTSLQRSKAWLTAQHTLHQYCFEHLGAKHIIVSGMPPMHAFPLLPQPLRWVMGARAKHFDALQRNAMASQAHKTYAPLDFNLDVSAMAEDGFHPGAPAYKEWAKAMAKRVLGLSAEANNKGVG
jgi:lysophospholipase L1-like esterase